MTDADGAPPPRMQDGFVHRGRQVTRLEAFVDAAFAFAVTLLVISIDAIPDSRAALVLALKSVPSFAACFAMIAMFWAAHARWSRRVAAGLARPQAAFRPRRWLPGSGQRAE